MFKIFHTVPKLSDLLYLFLALAVYILLLVIPPPAFISRVFGQPGWLILLLLFCFFAVLLRLGGTLWEGVQGIFILALFAIPLIYKWQSAKYDDFILGGLQPWSDASAYLQEAQRLLQGLLLTPVGARRPLFHGFLAALLYFTGMNFMTTLAALNLINALAVTLTVRVVRRSYGALGASFLLIFEYAFYMRFAGTTMTEQLGFALGNLAVFFLLIAAQDKSFKHALPGLGLLSLALIARAGAFFILPAVIVWIIVTFRSTNNAWRAAGLAIAVTASAFLLNTVLLKSTADPQGIPFSNYSYTLYGLASGNKGWTQAGTDHPYASEQEVMQLALEKIRSDPNLFLKGMLGSFRDYFTTDRGAFTFIPFGPLQTKANILLLGFILIGLVYAVLNWREDIHGLVLASMIGVFTSLPLVPPIDANDMRAYAATIPFTALWIVEGGYALIAWGKKLAELKEVKRIEEVGLPVQGLAIGLSALLVFLVFPAPILIRLLARSSAGSTASPAQTACMPGQLRLQGFMLRNTSVNLIPNAAAAESYMPFIRVEDFRSALSKKNPRAYPFLDDEFLNLQGGQQISLGFDLEGENEWLISSFPLKAGKFSVCGEPAENQDLRLYGFYTLQGQPVRPQMLTISQQYPGVTLFIRLLYGLATCIGIFLLVMASLDLERKSPVNFLYGIGIIILVLQGVFVALYSQAIIHLPFTEQRIALQVKEADVNRGLYSLPLGINWMSQDDLGSSPAIVYENGIPLSMPNSKPKSIRIDGKGRYSVTQGTLYFSSSDNTDPRTNGRNYELEWPHPIHPILQWLSYLVSLLGVAILVSREWFTRFAGIWLVKLRAGLPFK